MPTVGITFWTLFKHGFPDLATVMMAFQPPNEQMHTSLWFILNMFPLCSCTTSRDRWQCGKTLYKGESGNKQPVDEGEEGIRKVEVSQACLFF